MGVSTSRSCGPDLGLSASDPTEVPEGTGGGAAASAAAGGAASSAQNLRLKQQREAVAAEVTSLKPLYKKLFREYDQDEDGFLSKQEFRLFYRDSLMALGRSKDDADDVTTAHYQGIEKAAAVFESLDINYDGKVSFAEFWDSPHTASVLMVHSAEEAKVARAFFATWTRRPISKIRRSHVSSREPREKFESGTSDPEVAKKLLKKHKDLKKRKKVYAKTPRWGAPDLGLPRESGSFDGAGDEASFRRRSSNRLPGPSVLEGPPQPSAPIDYSTWTDSQTRVARAGSERRTSSAAAASGSVSPPAPASRRQLRSESAAEPQQHQQQSQASSFHSRRSIHPIDPASFIRSLPVGGARAMSDANVSPRRQARASSDQDQPLPRTAKVRQITPGGPAFPYTGASEARLEEDARRAIAESQRLAREAVERSKRASGDLSDPAAAADQDGQDRVGADNDGHEVDDEEEEVDEDEWDEEGDVHAEYDRGGAAAGSNAPAYEYEEDRDAQESDEDDE